MGVFSVEIRIADLERSRWRTLDALVDTGASTTAAPASVLLELGIEPTMRQRFRSAHGESRAMDVGHAWVRVEGKEIPTLVLFNDEGTTPILGALAFGAAFMTVDPVEQRLIPVDGLI